MNTSLLRLFACGLIGLTTLGILLVSILAFVDPQSVMQLVQVKLPNTDAYSSIRGVYGGAGLSICIVLGYLGLTNPRLGLTYVAILSGLYAFSRLITALVEGPLGAFGQQWMIIEASISALSILVLIAWQRAGRVQVA